MTKTELILSAALGHLILGMVALILISFILRGSKLHKEAPKMTLVILGVILTWPYCLLCAIYDGVFLELKEMKDEDWEDSLG